MNKLSMKQKVTEIARDSARQCGLTQTADIMGFVPELMESVEVDLEYVRKTVEQELNKKTGNPVNVLLGLLNLRIVNTRKVTEELGLEEQSFVISVDEKDSCAESMLKVNQQKLAAAANKAAAGLAAVEASFREEREKSRNESSRLFSELDKKNQECEQLNADLQGQKAAVMEHAQYMLSLLGREADSPVGAQLLEMLEDIGVYVHWKVGEAPFTEAAMFTDVRCDEPAGRRMKPCLASKEAVLVKGIRFVAKDAE